MQRNPKFPFKLSFIFELRAAICNSFHGKSMNLRASLDFMGGSFLVETVTTTLRHLYCHTIQTVIIL